MGKVEEPEEGEEDRNIKLKILSEAVLSSEEDAPMTLAVTRKVIPFNLPQTNLTGNNRHWHQPVKILHNRKETEQTSQDL